MEKMREMTIKSKTFYITFFFSSQFHIVLIRSYDRDPDLVSDLNQLT